MIDDIHETSPATPNFRTELAEELAELMPEAIADGKVDVGKIKELLDGDAADTSERFGLFWPGKKRALRAAQEPTTATLKPDFENSKDWDTTKNVFIEGDNLEVLKILQKHYHAKIKMIYIDPPYNTGKDFVYPDNYKEGLDSYLEWTRQVNEEGKKLSSNADTDGRYHSNWLNMMYPRLKLARNLLTDDGVIFISIDDSEQDNLQKLANEVFGESNLLGKMVWHARGRSKTALSIDHEYIVVYARNKSRIVPLFDNPNGTWYGEPVDRDYRNPDDDPRGSWRDAQHTVTKKKSHYTYSVNRETGEVRSDVINTKEWYGHESWMYPPATIQRLYRDGRLYFIETRGRLALKVKKFKSEEISATALGGLIQRSEISSRHGSEEVDKLIGDDLFSYPKPVALIQRLLRAATRGRDTVLDFFAGSGSTAHAVMQLNAEDGGCRRVIQVQLPEPTPDGSPAKSAGFDDIASVARFRMAKASERISSDIGRGHALRSHPMDLGFRSFKLADTNFGKWRLSSDVEEDALQQHLLSLRDSATDDASTDDLLTEILLKQGLSLTEQIAPVEVSGLELRSVDGGLMLAYLNEHAKPTLDQLRAVVDESPQRLIILEDAFQGDDELKTNLAQLCKSKRIELWTA
ncbi:site-specific DNA-methyltransferase [Corynebacterium variabile]|uniref:site-specific DNA-methyltransferase n=1 Tax=Corynebacterium variabile TaxID=1727 RepID=UPI003BB79369